MPNVPNNSHLRPNLAILVASGEMTTEEVVKQTPEVRTNHTTGLLPLKSYHFLLMVFQTLMVQKEARELAIAAKNTGCNEDEIGVPSEELEGGASVESGGDNSGEGKDGGVGVGTVERSTIGLLKGQKRKRRDGNDGVAYSEGAELLKE